MSLNFNVEWLLTVVLCATRLGTLFFLTPFDLFGKLPPRIKVLMTFCLATFFVSILNISIAPINNVYDLLINLAGEAYIGLLLVFGVQTAFAVFMLAGKIVDFQSGLSAAAVLNPTTQEADALIGTLLMLVAGMIFFLSDMHLLMLRGIAYSFTAVPPGKVVMFNNMALLVKEMGSMFSFGFALVVPVVMLLFLIDVTTGIVSRTMPQMNVYFVLLPLKLFVALSMLTLALRFMMPLIQKVFKGIFEYWMLVLK